MQGQFQLMLYNLSNIFFFYLNLAFYKRKIHKVQSLPLFSEICWEEMKQQLGIEFFKISPDQYMPLHLAEMWSFLFIYFNKWNSFVRCPYYRFMKISWRDLDTSTDTFSLQSAGAVRIHWLHLCRGVKLPQWVSWYDTKQSDGVVPVMLEL